MSNYPPHYAYPSAPPLVRIVPNPPRLHWGWVLVLNIITLGLFGMVWLFVQANWCRRLTGSKKAFGWALAYLLIIPGVMFVAVVIGMVYGIMAPAELNQASAVFQGLTRIAVLILYVFAAFTLKGELEKASINIPLSGVMTFFFGPTYFQYHLHDYQLMNGPDVVPGTLGLGLGRASGADWNQQAGDEPGRARAE